MKPLGYNTRGTEQVFEKILLQSIQDHGLPCFVYMEVGIAEGTTLLAVADLFKTHKLEDWYIWGIDLLDGPFFNPVEFMKKAEHEVQVVALGKKDIRFLSEAFNIVLLRPNQIRKKITTKSFVNFALIDGCHGTPCVMADFLWLEDAIAPGGIVAFHDAGYADQGIHFQAHCQQPIGVRQALVKLGLLLTDDQKWINNSRTNRQGWEWIAEVDGDKTPNDPNLNGHGFAFFRKVK